MKEQTLLRAHLLNKFDELPVNGNSVADWKKMEKALQIAMPIGLLSFVVFGKGWLLSKKLMWLWISIVTCGGAATTLAVYQSRQASLAPASYSVNKHNKPNLGSNSSHVLAAVNDTAIRGSKKHKTKKVLRKNVGTSVIKSKTIKLNDTVVRPLRTLGFARTLTDTSLRLRKNLRSARILADTSIRLRKNLRPARTLLDTSMRLRKNLRPVRTLKDTSLRLRTNLKFGMDSSLRLRKNLRPVKTLKDTSLRLRTNLKFGRDTSLKLRKNLRPVKTVKSLVVKPLKNVKPVKPLGDTLIKRQ